MAKLREPKPGEKMTFTEAKAYVDHLYETMYQHWKEKIHNGPFMTQLRAGKLPMPVMRQFFKNWGRFSMEYCAFAMVDLHAQMKRAAMDNPYP